MPVRSTSLTNSGDNAVAIARRDQRMVQCTELTIGKIWAVYMIQV